MASNKLVNGLIRTCTSKPNTIYISIADDSKSSGLEFDYGDIHEAIGRFFVDRHGYTTSDFKVYDATLNRNDPTARVEFTNESAVMAKLQGFLQ